MSDEAEDSLSSELERFQKEIADNEFLKDQVSVMPSGMFFNPILVTTSNKEILIEDIARVLSNLCRFEGTTSSFYSVAHHSLVVLSIFDELYPGRTASERLQVLLHDACEAFLRDFKSTVKPLLSVMVSPCQSYPIAKIERFWGWKIRDQFWLSDSAKRETKRADLFALQIEAKKYCPGLIVSGAIKIDDPEHFDHLSRVVMNWFSGRILIEETFLDLEAMKKNGVIWLIQIEGTNSVCITSDYPFELPEALPVLPRKG